MVSPRPFGPPGDGWLYPPVEMHMEWKEPYRPNARQRADDTVQPTILGIHVCPFTAFGVIIAALGLIGRLITQIAHASFLSLFLS
jgi:hypothetical protein